MELLVANMVGLTGLVLGKWAVFFRSDKLTKILMGLALMISSMQYLVLGEIVGFLILSLAGIRFITFAYYKHYALLILFTALFLATGYWTVTTPMDTIPVLMALLITFSAYYLKGMSLRLSFVVCSAMWASYNLHCGAYVSGCADIVGIFTGLWAVHLLYRPFGRPEAVSESELV